MASPFWKYKQLILANLQFSTLIPDPLYEAIMNGKRGNILMDAAGATNFDTKAQKYPEEVLKLINNPRH